MNIFSVFLIAILSIAVLLMYRKIYKQNREITSLKNEYSTVCREWKQLQIKQKRNGGFNMFDEKKG